MNVRTLALFSTLSAATMLTACGGGSGSPGSLPPSGGGQNSQSQNLASINAANSVGSPLKDYSDFNESTSSPAQLAAHERAPMSISTTGQCSNGIEFYAPDKNGDANSTERIVFYDAACTQPAQDAVRIYSSTSSSSETVHRTVTMYASGSTSPLAVRSETIGYTNASFDRFGYPVAAGGFDRTSTGNLGIDGVKTIDADSELSLSAASGTSQTFCGDSAGFNATGNQQLGVTFGWAGAAATGTRTKNADGSVTWAATHAGATYSGPIGSLAIAAGSQNTVCPITTPMFSLTGGTTRGAYSLPISATFSNGLLSNLTVTNATLANGNTLNVQTNSGQAPSSPTFISGTVANSAGTQIASFNVNGFGDGVLTVAGGNTYGIVDWHVVK